MLFDLCTLSVIKSWDEQVLALSYLVMILLSAAHAFPGRFFPPWKFVLLQDLKDVKTEFFNNSDLKDTTAKFKRSNSILFDHTRSSSFKDKRDSI